MASAHVHLNNEVMNNNRPPAPKSRKWLMRNNKSSLSGLMYVCQKEIASRAVGGSARTGSIHPARRTFIARAEEGGGKI